ncbi:hypothetical protein P170DRAFT_432491 [Aspergillus steynii IBT 23096]|uniref:Uncharacterized protein n=1 Tax=Aspergillus steynii IBT 23096 TaxID=1392250 RepID=A0A2I2GQ07_9EURO|nr:uncharacterized protein P170DRAFT_432491 [Aspergillus steynii IBT 23096]PLB54965.1 hypothetical protein P170DRAFT_432491 [Aspergillus steynii IBT 23096]
MGDSSGLDMVSFLCGILNGVTPMRNRSGSLSNPSTVGFCTTHSVSYISRSTVEHHPTAKPSPTLALPSAYPPSPTPPRNQTHAPRPAPQTR